MYEGFFNFTQTPFVRNIPIENMYETEQLRELVSRLEYAAIRRNFAVITGDVGTGKTSAVRKFSHSMDANRFKILYISDSALTPRNFYHEALSQLGCEARFYRGDAKRQLQKEVSTLIEVNKKIPVIVVDEAHLLTREMLEEIRFLLNYKMDSYNPLSLVLVGQSEPRELMKLQVYEAISQRVTVKYALHPYEKIQCKSYIQKHLEYAGCSNEIFTEDAVNLIHEYSAGVARKVNNVCSASLMCAANDGKRLIDDRLVNKVIVSELEW